MWIVDFPTLVLVIAAGLQLGLQGLFGINSAAWLFGSWANTIFALMGLSAVWQLWLQRFSNQAASRVSDGALKFVGAG